MEVYSLRINAKDRDEFKFKTAMVSLSLHERHPGVDIVALFRCDVTSAIIRIWISSDGNLYQLKGA